MAEDLEEPIDLDKLKPRELLILLAKDVKEIKADQKEMKLAQVDHQREQQEMSLKVNTLETKSKVWSGVVGFISGIFSGAGVAIFQHNR